MSPKPAILAKWMLIVFSAGMLASNIWDADVIAVALLRFAFLPWIVGPSAVAALLTIRTTSRIQAWCFFVGEIAAVCSTAWLWIILIIEPDAQNGITIMLFPIVQFTALLLYASTVMAIALFIRRRQLDRP